MRVPPVDMTTMRPPVAQLARSCLKGEEHAPGVRAEYEIELLRRALHDRLDDSDGRVRDDDVRRSECGACFTEQALHFLQTRNVGLHCDGPPAATANRSHDFLRGLLTANVVHYYSCAVRCETLGDGAANAARAAGDDGDFS
jgi:hypothetical protein